MLPFVLVLLVASSAFAAPSVSVNQYSINEIPRAQDSGRLVSSYIPSSAFELVDGGDTNIYILSVQQILNDLANLSDAKSQALAVSQVIAVLGELASGVPGDACEAASLIDAYAFSVGSGNKAGVRAALANYIGRIQRNIDLVAQLAANPNAVRYAVGPRGNCAGSGRSYQFEAAWDAILAASSPYSVGLVNEEYCAAKRLYSAFNARSNNVGAAVTAAAVDPVVQVVQQALPQLANFLRAAVSGGNPGQAAAAAKSAVNQAYSRVQL